MSEVIHVEHSNDGAVKEIWKVTGILTVLTLVELGLGFWMMKVEAPGARLAIKGTIVILMMVKAFYIVGYFMHLKHELKNLIMTIVVPLLLFVWFIIAFLYEGNSYKNLRNTYDPYKKEQTQIKVEKKTEEHNGRGTEKHKAVE
ncbi:MAG: cytochrome C oxidase subunit IV family protein [Deinococcales bacterium]|nr:cytochrome C oxidase subunit IV family protein [Chitinophagaceae bacterium]